MAEPIVGKEKEENNTMDVSQPVEEAAVTPEEVNNEEMEVSENANEILDNKEAEEPMEESVPEPEPVPEPVSEVSPELTFPSPSKKTRRAKCPPGCMRKPKCGSTGGKRSKKSKKTKGGKKSRKGGKKSRKGSRKSRKNKK